MCDSENTLNPQCFKKQRVTLVPPQPTFNATGVVEFCAFKKIHNPSPKIQLTNTDSAQWVIFVQSGLMVSSRNMLPYGQILSFLILPRVHKREKITHCAKK